ncbi:MAG TPA: hypothetical protein VGC88_02865 [Terriglobales bacterium]
MKLLCALAALLICATATWARPVPIPGSEPVAPVFERSDLVCLCIVQSVSLVGEVSKQMEDGVLTYRSFLAKASVRESFKGESDPSVSIEYVAEDDWGPSLNAGEIVLLFLKRTPDRSYGIADEWIGITRFTTLMYAEGEGLAKLESALRQELFSGEEADQTAALHLLHGFPHVGPLTLDTASTFVSAGTSADVRVAALAMLVKFEPAQQGLAALASFLADRPGDTSFSWMNVGFDVSQIHDCAALKQLGALSAMRNQDVQFGAMQAIRNMHDPSSAATLIKHLDDKGETRYQAAITLYEIFGDPKDQWPGMDAFDKHPEKYVAYWKQWWVQRQRAVQ